MLFLSIMYHKINHYTGPEAIGNNHASNDPTFVSDDEAYKLINPLLAEIEKFTKKILDINYIL